MILSVHILVGAAVGAKINNIYGAFLGGVLFHFFSDVIPHIEYDIDKDNVINKGLKNKKFIWDFSKVIFDGLFGIILVMLLIKQGINKYIFFGILGGITPDFIEFLALIFPLAIFRPISIIHKKIHFLKNLKIPAHLRIATQVIVAIVAIYFLV